MPIVPLPGSPAPPLDLPLVGGGQFRLTDQHPATFTLVVFYRGWHCPICRGYLAQLDRAVQDLGELGVAVVAVSGDTEERARQSASAWHLSQLALAYGQTVNSMREWGLFVSRGVKEPEPALFAEPGVYLVRPDGTLYMVILNSMPAARPRVDDLVDAISFFVAEAYPARGEA